MDSMENDFMKTLPYFLSHGTRSNELCFVMYQGELRCVIYIDENDHYIQTIPHELWDAKVVDHYYEGLLLYEGQGKGIFKRVSVVNVHYVEITR